MNSQDSHFVDFVSYKQSYRVCRTGGSRLIKAGNIAIVGERMIEVSTNADESPSVVVHKDHDTIVALEFRCQCGCSATVALDYEQ
jgi:hypothetical protein